MTEKILIVELPDFIQPRTQSDLDSLQAADVAELTDADLAAAFARLVAGVELRPSAYGLWFPPGYGFTLATVAAIQARGWTWEVGSTSKLNANGIDACVWVPKLRDWRRAQEAYAADPARALMAAAVLAAIAERDN